MIARVTTRAGHRTAPASRGLRCAALLLALLVLMFWGAGCIVVPIPANRYDLTVRTNVAPETVARLASANVSKAELLLQLGEPDRVSLQERELRFHTERIKWDIYWVVVGYYPADSGDIEIRRYYDLVVRFDEGGKLIDACWLEGPAPDAMRQKASATAPVASAEHAP
jgi:hypothetical protein